MPDDMLRVVDEFGDQDPFLLEPQMALSGGVVQPPGAMKKSPERALDDARPAGEAESIAS